MTEPATTIEAAQALAALGWHLVPIAPGQKHPAGLNNWQKNATDDLATIRQWWNGPYEGHGVGVATGARSGIWALDIDTHDGLDGYAELRNLTDQHGRLPATVQSATGGGGAHIIFAWDPARPITNGMATRLPAGLDIRGEGGQIVLPPTIHPSGQPYEWVYDPWTADVAEAPEWLYELLLAEPDPPAQPAAPVSAERPTRPVQRQYPDDGETPAEWINTNHDWHTELNHDGWTIHSTKSGQTWWTRPGKAIRDGHSAVLHEPDGPLVVFTTSLPANLPAHAGTPTTDGSGISYGLFGYIAATRHNGDRSEAARAARAEMGNATAPAVDIRIGQGQAAEAIEETAIDAEPSTWAPVDLAHAINQPPPRPEYLTRPDGVSFLYPGRDHVLFGPSESGKSWAAFITAHQALELGHRVLIIDFEDDARSVAERMTALGTPRAALLDPGRFRYVNPHEALTDRTDRYTPAAVALEELIGWGPQLVVIDGVTEGMTLEGLATVDAGDVAAWYALLSRRFRTIGACVVMIDHTAKGLTDGSPTEFGSQHKRSGISGASFIVDPVRRPGRAVGGEPVEGMLRLRLAKDRGGFLRGRFRGEMPVVTDITVTSYPDGGVTYHIDQATDESAGGADNLTAELVETLWAMGRLDGMSGSALCQAIGRDRSDKAVFRRLAELRKEGALKVEESGRSKLHKLTTTGRERYKELLNGEQNAS